MAKYLTEKVWQNELNLRKKILHNEKKREESRNIFKYSY